MKASCKDCTKRFVGCHSTCEEYLQWKRERVERAKLIHEGRAKDAKWIGARWTQSRWREMKNKKG